MSGQIVPVTARQPRSVACATCRSGRHPFISYREVISRTLVPRRGVTAGWCPFLGRAQRNGVCRAANHHSPLDGADGPPNAGVDRRRHRRVRHGDDPRRRRSAASNKTADRHGSRPVRSCSATAPVRSTSPLTAFFEQVIVQVPRGAVPAAGPEASQRTCRYECSGRARRRGRRVLPRARSRGLFCVRDACARPDQLNGVHRRRRPKPRLRNSTGNASCTTCAESFAILPSTRTRLLTAATCPGGRCSDCSRDTPRSLADELREIRVTEAQRLLRTHPDRPVADIAAASGFRGETQLRRAFRAVADTTPGRYRSDIN